MISSALSLVHLYERASALSDARVSADQAFLCISNTNAHRRHALQSVLCALQDAHRSRPSNVILHRKRRQLAMRARRNDEPHR